MPKRTRTGNKDDSQQAESLDDVDRDDAGHTPKWTRSSPSASPPPPDASETQAEAHSKNINTQDMRCTLPGHAPLTLPSSIEFEAHYLKEHNNQCIGCKANLPTPWLLELHQTEKHDPLVAADRDKGEKTYRCFLQDCEKVTLTPQKRRLHLIDKHGFPKDYDFRIVDSGLGGRRSLLRDSQKQGSSQQRRRISDVGKPGWRDRAMSNPVQSSETDGQTVLGHENEQIVVPKSENKSPFAGNGKSQGVPESTQPSNHDSMDVLSTKLSSLTFVPLSVRLKNKKKQ